MLKTSNQVGVILAGGLGTRLRKVVFDRAKPMAEVNGRPFLDYLVERLFNQGISEIVICVSYKRESIISFFQNKYEKSIQFSIEEEPLGTGGALTKVRAMLPGSSSYLVLNGDTYLPIDYEKFRAFHTHKQADLSVGLAKSSDSQFACVTIDSTSRITEFGSSPNLSGLVNAGIYWMEKAFFDLLPSEKVFSLEKDFLPGFVHKGKAFGYVSENMFIDIGTPESYQSLLENEDILKK